MRLVKIIAILGATFQFGCSFPPVQNMSVQQYANQQLRAFQAESEKSCPYGVKTSRHVNRSAMEIDFDSTRGKSNYDRYHGSDSALKDRQRHSGNADVVCLSKSEAEALKKPGQNVAPQSSATNRVKK